MTTLTACRDNGISVYESLVKQERKKNIKINDIFFGISLGMEAKDFYKHCWDLNRKGLFTDGIGNTSVNYKLVKNELKYPADMNFYPEFKNEKISSMGVLFQYAGWGPWTRELDADKLLPDVLKLYNKWYPRGNPFVTITDPERGIIYVKVDGNRRIILGRYDDTQVKADYVDLSVNEKS
jgi:hypothetical protein